MGKKKEKQRQAARGASGGGAAALPPTELQLPATEPQEEAAEVEEQEGARAASGVDVEDDRRAHAEEVSGWSGWRCALAPCMIDGCLN